MSKKFLNDHFASVMIQKVIKNKLINNNRAYVRMKNKVLKIQQNSLYTLTNEQFDDNL